MPLIDSLPLTEDEVRRRKAYLEITPDDERRLREARPHLQAHARAIIDRFYEYLLAHEHTRAILSAPGVVERLKELQARYFDELTSGAYDLAYFENRLRVGEVHHRIELAPEWYLGAYVKYLHIATDVLSRAYGRDYERYFQTTVSLTKIIYLDMGLALDAYYLNARDALERKNRELERLQAARRQLTDMIVHDLQNPLSGILAFLQGFRGRAELTEFETRALQEALYRCDDLSRMISNVLQVSRAESGRIETYLENFDLAQTARQTVTAWRPMAERDGQALDLEAPGALPVRSDQTLVDRILQNLVRNALRHTPAGTRVRVRVATGADGRALVEVADDGPGIPPHVHPLLFQPFGGPALRDAGLRVDTGLGLAFCRVAADALGAEFQLESDGKRGCIFRLRLAAAPGPAPA